MEGPLLPSFSKSIYSVFLPGFLYIPEARISISLISRITQKNSIPLVRPKMPLVKKDFEKLYLPKRLATAAISSIKMKKPRNMRTPFSFISLRKPPIRKTRPKTAPASDNKSIPYLSTREAWSVKLSIVARKNIASNTSHADFQYFEIKFLKMNVRARTEIAQDIIVKTNGGIGKTNWKTFKIIITDDKKGDDKTR